MSRYSDQVIADGAVAYWRLDETSGTTAVDIVGGYNGTISGGVTLNQSGALADGNKAMAFDGTTGKIATTQTVTIPVTCTVEAWVRGTYTSQDPILVVGTEAPLFAVNGNRNLTVYDGNSFGTVSGTQTLTTGTWYHVAYVLNGSTVSFYINGVLDRTAAAVRGTPQSGLAQIGHDAASGTTDFFCEGLLDEVAIYPTVLSANQIANHYGLGRLAPSYNKSLSVGIVTDLVQSEIYKLPRRVHVTSSTSIESSNDGTNFTALTNAETTGAFTSASYVRTLNTSCSLVAKRR